VRFALDDEAHARAFIEGLVLAAREGLEGAPQVDRREAGPVPPIVPLNFGTGAIITFPSVTGTVKETTAAAATAAASSPRT